MKNQNHLKIMPVSAKVWIKTENEICGNLGKFHIPHLS